MHRKQHQISILLDFINKNFDKWKNCEIFRESDVCVMGLNENHGQRILLRLRTDDLKGFRKILSIKQVLCHELAHNVHSEHDNNFY